MKTEKTKPTAVPGSDDLEQSYDDRLQAQAEIGRKFTHDFISSLADDALHTITTWMRSNQLPEPVVGIIDNLVMLERAKLGLKAGTLSVWETASLVETVPETTQQIAQLGGVFVSKCLRSIPREPIEIGIGTQKP